MNVMLKPARITGLSSLVGLVLSRVWLKMKFVLVSGLCFFAFGAAQAQAEPSHWVVAVPVANVRAAPEGGAALVTQLPQGTSVAELDRKGNWIQVRLDDESLAWMHQMTLSQSVQFLNQPLDRVTRAELRHALSEKGVRVIREVDQYPYDLYNPATWLPESTEMAVGYTLEDQAFAVAEITFRSAGDTDLVRRVAELVRDDLQMGDWDRVSGRRAEGPVEFEWRRGAVQVTVQRGWPDTTTYLTYEMPSRMEQMQRELRQRQ